MKKLLIIITILFCLNNVYAKDGLPHNLWDGSNQIPLNSYLPKYIYGNGGSATTLYIGIAIPYDNGQLYVEQEWQYLKLTFCMNNSPEPDFTFNNNNVVNSSLGQIDTSIPCNIWGTGDGNITFVYATPNDWNLPGYQLPGLNLSLTIKPNVSWNWTAILTKIEWSTDNLFVNDYNNYKDDITNNTIINQNDQIINNQSTINNSINNVDNTINNDNVDSPNNALSNLNSYLATNSTISNLIILPITLFQKVLTSLNGTCSSYDLGEYKGTHIILPCINISDYIGITLFNVIDVLISGLLIYKMSRKFIAVFHNLSSMKEGDVISD